MKKIQLTLVALTAAAALVPGIASASVLLDTGTPPLPTSTGPQPMVLNKTDWWAAEFTVGAGETITQLAAYLTQGVGQPEDAFTWALYTQSGISLGTGRPTALETTSGTFDPTTSGWSVTDVDWTVAPGDYWIAMQVSSTSQTRGLDLPVETSATTGTVPALGFAFAGSTGRYSQSSTGVGLEVSAVPLPAAALLFGSGLLGLGTTLGRRRRC